MPPCLIPVCPPPRMRLRKQRDTPTPRSMCLTSLIRGQIVRRIPRRGSPHHGADAERVLIVKRDLAFLTIKCHVAVGGRRVGGSEVRDAAGWFGVEG